MVTVAVCSLLAACSSTSRGGATVVDRNAAASKPATTSGQYVVRRGDTLYSIAFRYGWDWKALAARNNIPAPYTIRPGQSIRFDGGPSSAPSVAKNTTPVAPVIVNKPATTPAAASKPTTTSPAPIAQAPASSATPAVSGGAVGGWIWPTNGTLIGRFASNGSLNKGIDIAGQLGQPVLAASNGTVVYAGSGLRGYGELVIIKHSDTYVSAYGHNRRLLVREGQQVKVGQNIAEMGSTGTDRVKLHFEIRRQGKPVDPLQYLPSR
ncbi:peptidoglycan DD-metalloendopeptidase family protein [Pseudomonas sp. PDNC002]|uniref:peptidoglycan DD-metalloendopeptidase family protein n=1 Tax=Pseudomonas sp. PDNC002 TaxID=2811422 RepID=UPI001966A8A6|nr:peptidoglycan DD-metalloendopeptidase family protein [Pseudomonas sp. PDNC002]QRY82413.1 peptidoglycan DD-metalloendopeptidase family protein [Pseudomonas sp. PDNC002]